MKYLDANVFLYAILYDNAKARACKEILLKTAKGESEAATSLLSWDEIVFALSKLLGREIAVKEGERFLKLPNLKLLKVDEQVISKAQKMIEMYAVKPRDAIHAASAVVFGCDKFVTDDSDFDRIKEIKRESVK
jgi:hypothetical protein